MEPHETLSRTRSIRRTRQPRSLCLARRDEAAGGRVQKTCRCKPAQARSQAKGQAFALGPRGRRPLEWLDTYIGTVDSTLQEAPTVLAVVRVDLPIDIGFGMVDNLMREVLFQAFIGLQCIAVHGRTDFYMLPYQSLQFRLAACANDLGMDLATTLENRRYDSLAFRAGTCDSLGALVGVHVTRLSADECFVHFDFSTKLAAEVLALHGEPDSMQHEPCGLLRDLDGAVKFPGGDAVAVAGNHPHGRKPLIQAKWGVFKDGPELDGELSLRMPGLALEHPAGCDETDVLRSASGAYRDAICPAVGSEVANAVVGILEIYDRFQKGFRLWYRLLCGGLNFAHEITLSGEA